MTSSLYAKHNYLNKNIELLLQSEITEYDLKDAGFNLIKRFGLLPGNEIDRLESMEKKKRTIEIGKIQRKSKDLSSKLNEAFAEARRWFFYMNQLEDEDILSIKKDAIFTLKKCNYVEKDNLLFREKNEYDSYLYLDKKEFLFNNNGCDVKGLGKESVPKHKDYMIDFLIMYINSLKNSKQKHQIDFIKDFAHYYKSKQLDVHYYREMTVQSLYRLNTTLHGNVMGIEECDDLEQIDISYNYVNIIIPLVRSI